MDIIQLYSDYSVDYKTEGHKHCHPGWVNTPCPHCTGNPGYHLGYNLQGNYYYCYRCGWHPIEATIAKLLSMNFVAVKALLKQYGLLISRIYKPPVTITKVVEHRMPSGTEPLNEQHKHYLESRGFDPVLLEQTWDLVGTGPVSLLDGISYKLRIIIPVIWDSQAVSFVSRDITGKSPLRYITCPKDRELIFHKSILYGRQEYWKDTGICVEGPTDAWKLGTQSFATFGIEYKNSQVREMARAFKRVAVCFDDDPQAVVQANKLVSELKFRGVDAFRVDIVGDPGGMKQEDADYLVKQLI
jgi:hypothetical protein